MSTPWFFLSYASISPEYDKEVRGFSADLVDAIRTEAQLNEKSIPDADIGFCAPTVMDEGDQWPHVLAQKLASCRVFVCLFSKRYFESAACGKEFKIFSDRLRDYVAQRDVTSGSFIVPVLWVAKKGFSDSLPRAARNLHYANPYLETVFECGGVYHLKMLSEEKGTYQKYVQHVAGRIIKAAEAKPPLLALEKIPSFDDSSNAWIESPAAPIGLDAVSSAPRQIRLTWENNSANELGFTVQRQREGARTEFVPIKQLNAGSTSYTDVRVSAGTTYHYRVCAFNDGGSSDYSKTVEIKTEGHPPPPMPSEVSGSAISKRQIDLHWKDNSSGRGGFKVERCGSVSKGSFEQAANVAPGVTSYIDTGLTPATTYIYRVCAWDDNGDSDCSEEITVTTLKAWPIPIPVLIPLVLVIIVAGTGLIFFRCKFAPSMCGYPPPTPTPTPDIIRTFWSDGFTNSSTESNPPVWQLGGSWETPGWQPRWETDNPDGVLVVQGTGVSVVKAFYFDNFELVFPVQFESGTRAGWIVRGRGDGQSGYTGICFILEKAGEGFQLTGYWGNPERQPDIAPEPQQIPITEYDSKAKDIIEVGVRVEGEMIFMVFQLQNSENNGRAQLQLSKCFTATAHLGNKPWAAGYVGVFSGDGKSRFSIDALQVNPLPQTKTYIDCKNPGPDIYLK